jgi:quinol monooxygenase YgiN
MPALPWTDCRFRPEGEEAVHVLASTLALERYSDVPRFLRWTQRIRKQLATVEGCAGYSLDARLLRKTFYTLSAWSSRDAMNRFVHSGEHARMLEAMAGRLGEATFVESTASAAELPLDWRAAKQRLAAARAPAGA